jgi:hypothetical protein
MPHIRRGNYLDSIKATVTCQHLLSKSGTKIG